MRWKSPLSPSLSLSISLIRAGVKTLATLVAAGTTTTTTVENYVFGIGTEKKSRQLTLFVDPVTVQAVESYRLATNTTTATATATTIPSIKKKKKGFSSS